MYFTATQCRERLQFLYEQEEKIIRGGKSYTIDNRTLERVDLKDIQNGIILWEKRLARAKRRRHITRIVPRDL